VNNFSDVPVEVEGVNGVGLLGGVASLAGDGGGYCALLTSGQLDCWGYGGEGDLGNGLNSGSPVPVEVEGVNGVGLLGGVASLLGHAQGGGYCALLISGGVDCWGDGQLGQLGNGAYINSDIPVKVEGVDNVGLLGGVASLVTDRVGFCAQLTSGGLDCWGYGYDGELGNGGYSNSDVPVEVEGVNGVGQLVGSASLVGDVEPAGYCALFASGGVDCWGGGGDGELGSGRYSNSDVPVKVE
jgi:hypothetical protein